jgi:hypothetical protein
LSKDSRLSRCRATYAQFLELKPREIETVTVAFSDFDGLSLPECKKTLRFVLETFDGLTTNDAWEEISWHALTSFEGLLTNLLTMYSQFKNQKDQNTFQQFCQNLDSLAYHLRMFGIPQLGMGGAQLEKTSATLTSELEKVVAARGEITKLQNEVRNLITPAVAGSLSQAFTVRKDILFRGRLVWGLIAVAIGVFCIHATYDFATSVNSALIAISANQLRPELIWVSVFVRTIILIPLYSGFGFSFAQYKKERDFEEEYAHKAAVATSLPNYGDLTREPAVRDQIVTGATNVIFSSPTSKNASVDNSEKSILNVKEILDSLGKLVGKKE